MKKLTNNSKKLRSLPSDNLIHTKMYWHMIVEELLEVKNILSEKESEENSGDNDTEETFK